MPLNAKVSIAYTQPLDPTTVNSNDVSLRQNSTGQPVPSTVTLDSEHFHPTGQWLTKT